MADVKSFYFASIDLEAILSIARVPTLAFASTNAWFRVCAISILITSTVGRLQINAQVDLYTRFHSAVVSIPLRALANVSVILTKCTITGETDVASAITLARASH
jgi:hypothetical protein